MTASLTNAVKILNELIAFKTDSVYEKHTDCFLYVENMLRANGWTIARIQSQYQDHLVAVNRGELHDITDGILLSGHLDVVPAQTEQFKPRIENGRLYGRGAVDMKFFAASILGQLDFIKNRPYPVVLVFTFDEEFFGHGIEAVQSFLRQNRIRPSACLLGEPTDFKPCIGTKGCLSYTTKVTGKSAHSSMPELGINALYITGHLLRFLEDLNTELASKNANLNVGQVMGGEKPNIVAASATLIWSLRAFQQEIVDDVLAKFNAFARELEVRYSGAQIETIPDETVLPPFYETREFPLLKRIQELLKTEKITLPYATEAGYYQQLDIPTVICGVPDSRLAHTDNEYIELTDFEKYNTFLHDLLCEI